jgi:asparagine synthase/glutamine amidotransferase-like protein
MNNIPGISIKFKPMRANHDESIDSFSGKTSGRESASMIRTAWLSASLEQQPNTLFSIKIIPGEISVLLEGYISDIAGECSTIFTAKGVAKLYRKYGIGFISELRGSFTCLIYDYRLDKAFLFNDRRGSRPLFYKNECDGNISFSPEVSRLALPTEKVSNDAACEFILFGSYYSDHTLFEDIKKLPQASLLTFSKDGFACSQYWRLNFNPADTNSREEPLIDECNELILHSTKRILRSTKKPFLFLSGGTDSRVLLGAILEVNGAIPTASYGTEEGDDFSVAKLLADENNLLFEEFILPSSPPISAYIDTSLASDCRAETIDTPTMGDVFRLLSRKYSTFINGDECFGWGATVNSHTEAFKAVGILDFTDASSLRDWLIKKNKKETPLIIKRTLSALYKEANTVNTNDLKDLLYYENRMGNMLNGFTANKLRYLEQGRPLLDEDLMEFVSNLPRRYRDDKYLLRKVLSTKYPQFMKIPLSTKDSIPLSNSYKSLFQNNQNFSSFVHDQLISGIDKRLASFLNVGQLKLYINALTEGQPQNIHTGWWHNLPGMWRLAPLIYQNRVPPIMMLLRILQINIYLKYISNKNDFS